MNSDKGSKLEDFRKKKDNLLNNKKSLEEQAEEFFEGIWNSSEMFGLQEHYNQKFDYFESVGVDCSKYRKELSNYYLNYFRNSPKDI